MKRIKGISEAFNHAKEWHGKWGGGINDKTNKPSFKSN